MISKIENDINIKKRKLESVGNKSWIINLIKTTTKSINYNPADIRTFLLNKIRTKIKS